MVLQYFSLRKSKDKSAQEADGAKSPVLSNADEKFLEKIASESAAPSNPEQPTIILDNGKKVKGTDAQIALMDGADKVPLPASPPEVDEDGSKGKGKNYWSYMPSIPKTTEWRGGDWAPYIPSLTRHRSDKEKAAADLASAAQAIKSGQQPSTTTAEEQREKDDLTSVLDQLNISATNNRAFSLSKESAKLMEDFTLILKDIVNGVPTAYDDLEKLLTHREKEITKMYNKMPPWLQTLVKSLPAKIGTSLAPELMAAASEKPGYDAQMKMKLDPNAKVGAMASEIPKVVKKKKNKIPTVKKLLSQQGAVAGMLKSILNFLKLRFPAFITGTNILMSLAVFLLLFVFWYCHKRGKETRLDQERLAAEDAVRDGEDDGESADNDTDMEETTILQPEKHPENEAAASSSVKSPTRDLPDPKETPLPDDQAGEKRRS